ncbi:MAG: phosphoglycerate dehydrogenase [Gemmatimonadaceae bacterium]|nr:phosphoglycerate dehydrogenase [Gemmatimonadaceae bacterium]
MPRVLIADALSPAAVDIFRQRGIDVDVMVGLGKERLLEVIGAYDGLAIRSATRADRDVIAAATRLRVIARAGIGVDNIDVAAASTRGIVVMNTPFGNSITTAEHALALLFGIARRLGDANSSTQAGKWEKERFMGIELHGKTLGVIGCGNIGALVAERALGLRMKVIAHDPFLSLERAIALGVEKVELHELLARADAITLHTPLTDKTRHLLDAETLAKTRPGVLIVNAARGELVDEAALRAALDSGHVAGAGFDVFSTEPARENVLFGARNFIATPHLGASTVEAQEKVALQVAEQISDYLLTGTVVNALNLPAMSADEATRLAPFVALAERLGLFVTQLANDGPEAIEITFQGEVSRLNTRPITAAALTGIMRPLLPDVNMVSAPAVLKDKGIPFTESRLDAPAAYESLLHVGVLSRGSWRRVTGTVVAGAPRIVRVKDMALEAAFRPVMLYVNNSDSPGFIGALGVILGEAQINIATFHLGRQGTGEEAVAIVGVDQVVPDEVQERIRQLPQVREVTVLRF